MARKAAKHLAFLGGRQRGHDEYRELNSKRSQIETSIKAGEPKCQ
jgi:hypothetical protein